MNLSTGFECQDCCEKVKALLNQHAVSHTEQISQDKYKEFTSNQNKKETMLQKTNKNSKKKTKTYLNQATTGKYLIHAKANVSESPVLDQQLFLSRYPVLSQSLTTSPSHHPV